MVALTGIEPDGCQSSSVQLGLSGCVFSTVGIPGRSETPLRTADVTAQSQRSRRAEGRGRGRRASEIDQSSLRVPVIHARPGHSPEGTTSAGTTFRLMGLLSNGHRPFFRATTPQGIYRVVERRGCSRQEPVGIREVVRTVEMWSNRRSQRERLSISRFPLRRSCP